MAQKIEACLICGEPLVYYETAREMTCVYCGRSFPSNAACEAGHFVCDACHSRKAVENILAYCGTCESRDPIAIARALMADPFVHMHGPEHHVLVGAALLTAWHNSGGQGDFPAALAELARRGEQVPGGACGFWGCCGAAVSAGIFFSVAAGATPLAGESWGLANRTTAAALQAIGDIGGPRCCKRDSFTAILQAADLCRRELGVDMEIPERVVCGFFPQNRECLGRRCPYHPAEKEQD